MLHHIVEYARAHVKDSEPGFTKRPIHWLLHISSKNQYINIEPYSEKKKGKNAGKRIEERCPDMPNMRAGKDAKRAHFLIENALAAALYIKEKKSGFKAESDDKSDRRNAYFRKLLAEAAEAIPSLKPAAVFFSSETEVDKLRQDLGKQGATANDWIMFCIDKSSPLQDQIVLGDKESKRELTEPFSPHRDREVLDWWRSWLARDGLAKTASTKPAKVSSQVRDLISGELIDPKDRHPPVKGLEDVGGNKSGTPVVCFDKPAFASFGLKAGWNAPISAINAQLYADGLTDLLKVSKKIAGTRVAYWYRDQVLAEDDPMAFLAGFYSEEQKKAGALASVRDLLGSIDKGERPSLLNNQYFAITLSGAAGRAMVRDWMTGDFKALAVNIECWFSDLEISAITGKKAALGQKFETIVTSLLGEKKSNQKYEDWVKPIGPVRQQLLHAAVQNSRISPLIIGRIVAHLPTFFISDEVQRAFFPKSERPTDIELGLTVSRLYARMGLIKAYFIRLQQGGVNTMKAYLNPDHPEPAYHCGRLLAVLAELQYAALGDVGAGVIQRYYAAASQMPGLILGRLVRNAQFHLNKPDKPWLKSKFEEPMMEISGKLKDSFPQILNLEGQGLFALGYYQQLAALRKDK